jgi:DUF971 family protein
LAGPADTPQSIEFLEPSTLLIEWGDGHESLYSHRLLRERCECAACIDEWTRAPILDPSTLPADIHVQTVERTGRYGLNLHFSDGHRTGIYAFRTLRGLCPCGECAPEREISP